MVVSNEADVLNQENELLAMIHARTKAELEKMVTDVESELNGKKFFFNNMIAEFLSYFFKKDFTFLKYYILDTGTGPL